MFTIIPILNTAIPGRTKISLSDSGSFSSQNACDLVSTVTFLHNGNTRIIAVGDFVTTYPDDRNFDGSNFYWLVDGKYSIQISAFGEVINTILDCSI